MDAELFLKTVEEECNKHGYTCNECGFRECPTDLRLTIEERMQIVQDYLDERKPKTCKEVFLEAFPNASLSAVFEGYPAICPVHIFGQDPSLPLCVKSTCHECWDSPAPDEYQKEGAR